MGLWKGHSVDPAIWAAPALALITGLGGVLLGQFLRERSAARQREADERRRFHDDRRALYGEFLAHLQKMRARANEIANRLPATADEVRAAQQGDLDWMRECRRLTAQIALLSDDAVLEQVVGAQVWATGAGVLASMHATNPALTPEQQRQRTAQAVAEFDKTYAACLNAMRKHLGQGPLQPFHAL